MPIIQDQNGTKMNCNPWHENTMYAATRVHNIERECQTAIQLHKSHESGHSNEHESTRQI